MFALSGITSSLRRDEAGQVLPLLWIAIREILEAEALKDVQNLGAAADIELPVELGVVEIAA